jgi:hypothetical protein
VKPWDKMRREIVGVWRSVRYDIDRRADLRDGEPDGSDTWFTQPVPERESTLAAIREPRRLASAAGVASIIVASAAGTYFAVAGGLGLLIADAAGVPVVPQAVPMMPLAPIPKLAEKKAAHKVERDPGRPGGPATPDVAAAPGPAGAPAGVAGPPVPAGPKAGQPAATFPTPPPVRHSAVPEATTVVTPAQTPSASPSPSASGAPVEHVAPSGG